MSQKLIRLWTRRNIIHFCVCFALFYASGAEAAKSTNDCKEIKDALEKLYLFDPTYTAGKALERSNDHLNAIYSIEYKIDWMRRQSRMSSIAKSKMSEETLISKTHTLPDLINKLDSEKSLFCRSIREVRAEAYRDIKEARNVGCLDASLLDRMIVKFNRFAYDENIRCGFVGSKKDDLNDVSTQIIYTPPQYSNIEVDYIDGRNSSPKTKALPILPNQSGP